MDRLQKRRLILLTGVVVSVHLFFLLFDFKAKKEASPPKKSLVVHTFTSRPPQKQKRTGPTKEIAHSKPVQKPKQPPPSQKKELLKQLKETLKPIEQDVGSSAEEPRLTFPKTIQSLQIDQTESLETPDYFLLLAHRLKEELELPEYGDVRLELTLHKSGKVLKVSMLQAVSEKNRKYLELNLLKMVFPPFGDEFKSEPMHTFILTFCNEI